tara:strand:+ start:14137 stop:14727 length:591 start_codon:yes stop_codon:yes gene_type:complete
LKVLLLSPIDSKINCFFDEKKIEYLQYNKAIDNALIKEFQPKIILSYRYRYIITKKVLEKIEIPILNLHSSFLPYNRGANPNFWSFYENTPKGTSIHIIDEGIDTGDIIYQTENNFDLDLTFRQTYERLEKQITEDFIKIFPAFMSGDIKPEKQIHKGTYHNADQINPFLKKFPNLWEYKIENFLIELKNQSNLEI